MDRPRLALAALLLACLAAPLCQLASPPNGFHTWREADTAQIAERFAADGASPTRPRVWHLGAAPDGEAGSELPAYTFAVSRLYRAFGFSHAWARGLSLAAAGAVVALIWSFGCWLGLSSRGALLAAFAAGWAPLLLFYGRKIQPDVLGLACALGGFRAFLAYLGSRGGSRGLYALLAGVLLAIAGGIKPTLLGVGLPMLVALHRSDGWAGLRRPWTWVVALLALGLPVLWLKHASSLNTLRGDDYFYLGGNWLSELAGVLKPSFYQNVLLTWPFELAPGALIIIAAIILVRQREALKVDPLLVAWIIAGLATCVMAAEHCATPHDYYYLPLLPPLALLAGAWIDRALATGIPRAWRVGLVAVVMGFPLYGTLRIAARFEERPGFEALRQALDEAGEREALAVAIDELPGDLLYRAGLRGWAIGPGAGPDQIAPYLARGASLVIVPQGEEGWKSLAPMVGVTVAAAGGVEVRRLHAVP